MSNWGTLIRRISEEVHRYNKDSIDAIKCAVCYTVGDEQYNDYYFNEDSFTFTTTAGVSSYGQESAAGEGDGYPQDFLKTRVMTLIVSNYSYGTLDPINIKEYRDLNVTSNWRGYPEKFLIDSGEIILWPAPNGVYTITVDYTKNIGTPIATWNDDDSVWNFTNSLTNVAVDSTDSNAWYDEASDLTIFGTKEYLSANVYKDMEDAGVNRKLKESARKQLIKEGRNSQIPPVVKRYY